jgi:zinc transporter ZupT
MKGHGPIIFRASLYFIAAFATPFLEKVAAALEKDQWPTPQRWLLSSMVGFVAGVLILRSFYDGSAQRHADANSNQSGKHVDTQPVSHQVQ